MAYFTPEYVAAELPNRPTAEWVRKQIFDPDLGPDGYVNHVVVPSFYAREPVLLISVSGGEPVEVSGWFKIVFLNDGCDIVDGKICFQARRYTVELHNDYDTYFPHPSVSIPIENLRIHHEEMYELISRTPSLKTSCADEMQGQSVSFASKTLSAHRSREMNTYVDAIMAKIIKGIKEQVNSRGENRIINHRRFVREAGVPEDKFSKVMSKVAQTITKDYGGQGFSPLSRAPKKGVEEEYFLRVK